MSRGNRSLEESVRASVAECLSEDVRRDVYRIAGLNSAQIENAEYMVAQSGQRDVGEGAKDNVRVQLYSRKNHDVRVLESHTCERLFAYELELDQTVLAYYAQTPCRYVARTDVNGRRHISSATLDFLVFRRDRIEIVECKPLRALTKLSKRRAEWHFENGAWTNLAFRSWAADHGLDFTLWSPPQIFAFYLQNIEATYDVLRRGITQHEQRLALHACKAIAACAMSLDDLKEAIPGFRESTALWMIANHHAHGPLRSTPLYHGDQFFLCSRADQSTDIDTARYERLVAGLEQPSVEDVTLLASPTDYAAGNERLNRLKRIEQGREAPTIRMKALAVKVRKALAEGRTALSACITNYANSGNRNDRLHPTQREQINLSTVEWLKAKSIRLCDLHYELKSRCEARGIPPPTKTSLRTAIRKIDPAKRALYEGGLRAYQAARSRTDPRDRSLPALLFGHTLHIDSSQFDNRCGPDLLTLLPVDKPTFYIGIDGSTDYPMAHAFVFGSAKTDGVMLLIREFVYRHGFLPSSIFLDRGPENTSECVKRFAKENGITLMYSPTGGSRYNGRAENGVKHVNTQVAHRFLGSTLPDAQGRKIDGRFKSKRAKKTAFITINEEFCTYVYGDLPKTPGENDVTPEERREQALNCFGRAGRTQEYNDDLLIATSVPIKDRKCSERVGFRTSFGYFGSAELQLALRSAKAEELRADCVDPTVIYAKIAGRWLKAFHKNAPTFSHLSPQERLFAFLSAPDNSRHRREERDRIGYERHQRQKGMAAQQAHPHLISNDVASVEGSATTSNPNGYTPKPGLRTLINLCGLQGIDCRFMLFNPREAASRPLLEHWTYCYTSIELGQDHYGGRGEVALWLLDKLLCTGGYLPPIELVTREMGLNARSLREMNVDAYWRYQEQCQQATEPSIREVCRVVFERSVERYRANSGWSKNRDVRWLAAQFSIPSTALSPEAMTCVLEAASHFVRLLGKARGRTWFEQLDLFKEMPWKGDIPSLDGPPNSSVASASVHGWKKRSPKWSRRGN